jgi:hypothetical protein
MRCGGEPVKGVGENPSDLIGSRRNTFNFIG